MSTEKVSGPAPDPDPAKSGADKSCKGSPSLFSFHSLLGVELDGEDEEDEDQIKLQDEDMEGVDWKERCRETQAALLKFRKQAARIREVLREKLADLERRVVEAERRAEAAEERAQLMEQRLLVSPSSGRPGESPVQHQNLHQHQHQSQQQSSSHPSSLPSTSPSNPATLLHPSQDGVTPKKDKVITILELEVEEQKRLRIHDAKQVEAKAAKIKEWVTNKLRELEDQNQHLREQNQKCNEQLELLRSRLVQISQLNNAHNSTLTTRNSSKHRASTEDSSRGSFEDRGESDDSLAGDARDGSPTSLCNLVNDKCHRNTVDGDLEHLYAAVDYSKKRSQLKSAPPRVKIERKKYENPGSVVSSIASDDSLALDGGECPPQVTGKTGDRNRPLPHAHSLSNHNHHSPGSKGEDRYGSLDRGLAAQRKLTLTSSDASRSTGKHFVRTENELHDYAEIYTPSTDLPDFHCLGDRLSQDSSRDDMDSKPPTPPLHRFPSWESRIYEVAVSGITVPESLQFVPTGSPNNNNSKANCDSYVNGTFPDLNIPVYATVKGRASQIRSVPFTGESSDSSDNEDTRVTTTNSSHTTSGETESSTGSPSRCKTASVAGSALSPLPSLKQGSLSPTKSVKRDTSVESVLSDDYAIPPDAMSSDALSTDSVEHSNLRTPNIMESPKRCQSMLVPNGDKKNSLILGTSTEEDQENGTRLISVSLEKSGYLTKLGGKLKTWRRRWFVLKNGSLSYHKSQNDVNRKPQGQITLDDVCRVTRAEGAATFEISTGKRTYYLTADSVNTMEEWVKVLQNVLRRNATRLLLSKEENRATIEGWLTKVKHGHSRRCWCVLIGRMFLYFKTPNDTTPLGQINMRDARVEEVSHMSDSDEEEYDDSMAKSENTVGIFPNHQGPTYLLMNTKQEMDAWMYHLTVVSSGDNFVGTPFEQLVTKLMEADGDENSVLWRHPLLLYSKDNIAQSLTTLPSDALQVEGVKLFKSIQLFISVPLETSGIDYHIALAQNALQQCLLFPELQNELFCQLIKQTSRHSHQRIGVQQLLLCATQSLFLCDTSSSSEKLSPTSVTSPERPPPAESKLNPAPFVFVQGWQLLALAVTLFLPKNRTLWYLRLHLLRNADAKISSTQTCPKPVKDPEQTKNISNLKTEAGKYATFCQRALERTLHNGARECKPSRMEVLSILLKNPYHHSLPHSIPVHFLNGTYQVVGFDGSSTVEEFGQTLNAEAGIRDSRQSGFALFSDDPIDKAIEHCLQPSAKLCDVISKWEQALREKHLGKFENTKVLKLTYKNRLCFRQLLKAETDRERILTAYQINEDVVNSRFPLSRHLALELAALMAQIEFGDYNSSKPRGSTGAPANPQHQIQQVVQRFFPQRYQDPNNVKNVQEVIRERWSDLKGRNLLDCVRIYLNCARKWSYCGSGLYSAKLRTGDQATVWIAVSDDSISLLDYNSLQPLVRYPYSLVVTFGGCRDDFMLVVTSHPGGLSSGETEVDQRGTERLLFAMQKPKILELTLLMADYMNALGSPTTVPPSPQASTLSRLEKIRAKIRATNSSSGQAPSVGSCSTVQRGSAQSSLYHTLSSSVAGDSPDLVKMTAEADGRLKRSDSSGGKHRRTGSRDST